MLFMGQIHFIGAGTFGNAVAVELSRIYEAIREGLFYEEYNTPEKHLHIHSYPSSETCDEELDLVILAGSLSDLALKKARKEFYERKPFLMLTILAEYQTGMDKDTLQPFLDEGIIVFDHSLCDPVAMAKLVLQIFFVNTLDVHSKRGTIVGYDLVDTKNLFAGHTAEVITLMMNKKNRRQNYTNFLAKHSEDIKWTKGILMTFWGMSLKEINELSTETTELLSPITNTGKKMNELSTETLAFLLSDIYTALTWHYIPDDETETVTLFFLKSF
jgi:hypothetical protein